MNFLAPHAEISKNSKAYAMDLKLKLKQFSTMFSDKK